MLELVVIGGNSFSGSHFVNYALDQGAQVISMSRSPEPSSVFLPYKTNKNISNFRFIQADLNRDLDRVMSVIHEQKIPIVVNFAAQSMVAESWAHPDHWFQTNVVSTVKLHDELRKCAFLQRYIHVSTPEVYGSCSGNIQENAPFNPTTPYAVSRAAADLSLLSFFRQYKFPVVFTRAANVFGPGQQLYRIVPRSLLYAKLGKKLPLHGGGHSVRSFIHIEDVARATFDLCTRGRIGEAYHLSTTRQIPIREVVKMCAELMGRSFEDLAHIVEDRPGKDAAYLLDSSKAEKDLGWKPRISLEQGLAQTRDWINSNIDEIRQLPDSYVHKA